MSAGVDPNTPRKWREGWPWPSHAPRTHHTARREVDAKKEADATVVVETQEVSRLARELVLAVARLEEAQLEVAVISDSVALGQAGVVIENAMRRSG